MDPQGPKHIQRHCAVCFDPIYECMGLVIARTLYDDRVKELCGLCGEVFTALPGPDILNTRIYEFIDLSQATYNMEAVRRLELSRGIRKV